MAVAPKRLTEAERVKAGAVAPGVRMLEDLPNLEAFLACRKAGEFWHLNAEELAGLMGTSRSTFFRWADGPCTELALTPDQRTRALAILRIFEAVGDLHPKDAQAHAWVREPMAGPGFEERTPLEIMETGIEGLLQVRDYLDMLHSGWS